MRVHFMSKYLNEFKLKVIEFYQKILKNIKNMI